MLDAYSRAWVWFGRGHADLTRRIAIRTGNVFKLKKIEENNSISACLAGTIMLIVPPMNTFQNETFQHASNRLTKYKPKKRVLKGGAKSFAKRKKETEELLAQL